MKPSFLGTYHTDTQSTSILALPYHLRADRILAGLGHPLSDLIGEFQNSGAAFMLLWLRPAARMFQCSPRSAHGR
jgi:hypothetical protein